MQYACSNLAELGSSKHDVIENPVFGSYYTHTFTRQCGTNTPSMLIVTTQAVHDLCYHLYFLQSEIETTLFLIPPSPPPTVTAALNEPWTSPNSLIGLWTNIYSTLYLTLNTRSRISPSPPFYIPNFPFERVKNPVFYRPKIDIASEKYKSSSTKWKINITALLSHLKGKH